jgi:hypothetical protein
MSKITNPLEIYKVLPKSNCGSCGISTCLAFAASVVKQEKKLAECPHLDTGTVSVYEGKIDRPPNMESIREEQLEELKKLIAGAGIRDRAELLGATRRGDTLIIKCLGKDFEIDASGNVVSQCHTHAWFSLPLLDYILNSKGETISGRWVPFRELEHGKTWNPLFEQRCEKPLKKIADTYNELFEDLITMFRGASSFNTFSSDIAVVLYPLPKVPILICYWKPEDDLESRLHVFFDDTAERNLPIGSLFTLGTGIVRMLERIMHTHTDGKSELD